MVLPSVILARISHVVAGNGSVVAAPQGSPSAHAGIIAHCQ